MARRMTVVLAGVAALALTTALAPTAVAASDLSITTANVSPVPDGAFFDYCYANSGPDKTLRVMERAFDPARLVVSTRTRFVALSAGSVRCTTSDLYDLAGQPSGVWRFQVVVTDAADVAAAKVAKTVAQPMTIGAFDGNT